MPGLLNHPILSTKITEIYRVYELLLVELKFVKYCKIYIFDFVEPFLKHNFQKSTHCLQK